MSACVGAKSSVCLLAYNHVESTLRSILDQTITGYEVIVSDDRSTDGKQRIDYWLPRESERRVIAEAGMRRAHREHTYELRLGLLLDTVAGTRPGKSLLSIRYSAQRCVTR